MTAPIPSVLTDALPGVEIRVREIQPREALLFHDDGTGELVIVHTLVEPGEPRPLVCFRHGVQRHDMIGGKYQCKVCTKEQS